MIEATFLEVAAVVSALSGIASTVLALRRTKADEQEQCLERLRVARAEAEKAAAELHERKMRDAS